MDVNFWLPVILAVIAASPGAYSLYRQSVLDKRRQPQAEVSEGIAASKSAAEVVRQYSDEIKQVRTELHLLRDTVDKLQGELEQRDLLIDEWQMGIERLVGQVVSLGHQPVWKPRQGVK